VVALEIGFPWSLVRQNGYPTLISSNALDPQGPETFGVSPAGQELYLRSFFQQMHEARGFVGALYWDPIWIDTPQLSSNVGDTALFDWEAKPLPALNAFGEKFW
jgi:arabinogalactan endo-1,4-beta-galactosidase